MRQVRGVELLSCRMQDGQCGGCCGGEGEAEGKEETAEAVRKRTGRSCFSRRGWPEQGQRRAEAAEAEGREEEALDEAEAAAVTAGVSCAQRQRGGEGRSTADGCQRRLCRGRRGATAGGVGATLGIQ